MKEKVFIVIYILLSVFIIISKMADAHDGQVNITGSIQSNTCIVDTDSKNMTVSMGIVSSKQFYEAGATSAAQKFTIKLIKCGDAATAVKVTFRGTPDALDPRLLVLDGGTGTASGMGIAILDLNRKPVALNTQGVDFALTPGALMVSLDFFAEYMANGAAVKAGDANATATFVLDYA